MRPSAGNTSYRWAIVTVLVLLLLLIVGGSAAAQNYDCAQTQTGNGFRLDCIAKVATPTRTPIPTKTPTKAPTPTQPPTATSTPTSTPVPPTATPLPPVASRPIVNVPLLNVAAGDPALDANNWSIVWLGDISPKGDYAQIRLIGADDGLHIYAQAISKAPTGEAITVTVGSKATTAAYPWSAGWTIGERCGGVDQCRGWTASGLIPWSDFGVKPTGGDAWPLHIAFNGAEWLGQLRWGLSGYSGHDGLGAQLLTVPVSDATLGGSTDCGMYDYPDYFPTWGSRSYEGDAKYKTFTNIQAQWDVADWPCYSRYIAKWQLPALPLGAQVISATLNLWRFGHAGYSAGDTGTTTMQVFDVSPEWDPKTVTWDNAPLPVENISRTDVQECGDTECGRWYAFDVTEIVNRALARGDNAASALLYTAAGQYHSGKYFYTSEGAIPPNVSISYVPPTVATATPLATATSTPTPTIGPTPAPLPTVTPSATALPTVPPTPTPIVGDGKIYYITTNGSDAGTGAVGAPFATFNRAWQSLQPGDTLIVGDGTYAQEFRPNQRNGLPGAPITIRAQNDGKAIIDGQGIRNSIHVGDTWPGPIGNYYVVEGLQAVNGYEASVYIRGQHDTFRRVSAYNASTDANSAVWIVAQGSKDILLEDVIAAGTARKEILIFVSDSVTVRRAFTSWTRWDGRTFCAAGWPAGNGINLYNSGYITVENSIAIGPVSDRQIGITANTDGVYSPGLKVLGSIAIGAGIAADGTAYKYPMPVPEGACPHVSPPTFYPGNRSGLGVYGQGTVDAPVFRDVLGVGNAQMGFSSEKPYGVGVVNGVLDHATLLGNGKYAIMPESGQGVYTGFTVTNSNIPGYQAGEGARLTSRYVDGVLTSQPLWPWPMESRGQAELGISITDIAQRAINTK